MDRFFDDSRIVKKPSTIQNVLNKAKQLKQQTQQKIDQLTPEQLESIQQANGPYNNSYNKDLINKLLTAASKQQIDTDINSNNEKKIFDAAEQLKSNNTINDQSIFVTDNGLIKNNLPINDSIKNDKKIYNTSDQLKTNNTINDSSIFVTEDELIKNNLPINNSIKNELVKNEPIKNESILSDFAKNKTVKKEISNNVPNQQQINQNIKKEILQAEKLYKPAEVLIRKQINAYNDLVNLQVELEIINRMSIRVEEKLRKSYNTKIYGLQTQIREQEVRLGVIADLLAGK